MKKLLLATVLLSVTGYVAASAQPLPSTPEEAVQASNKLHADLAVFNSNGFTTSCEGALQSPPFVHQNIELSYVETCLASNEEKTYVLTQEIYHVDNLNAYIPQDYFILDLEKIWGGEPRLANFTNPDDRTTVEAIFNLPAPR